MHLGEEVFFVVVFCFGFCCIIHLGEDVFFVFSCIMHLSDDVGDHGDDIVSDCDEDDDDHALVYIDKTL